MHAWLRHCQGPGPQRFTKAATRKLFPALTAAAEGPGRQQAQRTPRTGKDQGSPCSDQPLGPIQHIAAATGCLLCRASPLCAPCLPICHIQVAVEPAYQPARVGASFCTGGGHSTSTKLFARFLPAGVEEVSKIDSRTTSTGKVGRSWVLGNFKHVRCLLATRWAHWGLWPAGLNHVPGPGGAGTPSGRTVRACHA
jgi:hypothetical protein